MMKIFFNKKGEQKKWIIVLNIILPLLFSIWGIILSVKSYNLSVETSSNTEQIDSIKSQNHLLVTQINQISELLLISEKAANTQDTQLLILKNDAKYSKRPKIVGEFLGENYSEKNGQIIGRTINVRLSNSGGDIFNFTYDSPKNIKMSFTGIPIDKTFPNGAFFDLEMTDLVNDSYIITLRFNDNQMNKYSQSLTLTKTLNGYSFQIGALLDSK